jgi:hypoxanthine phosphoribosyltransferase
VTGKRAAVAELLKSRAEIAGRVRDLGRDIADRYAGTNRPPLAIGVLKGSTLFLADLLRAIPMEVTVDFMSISSYDSGGTPSGIVRILKDLEEDIGGRDVLIVEDIVDTGLTLSYLRRTLLERAPRSLETATLLDKRARRIVPVPLEHTGFEVPDVFVIGYGLDFQGLYRNLSGLMAVTDIARLSANPRVLLDAATRTLAGGGDSFGP